MKFIKLLLAVSACISLSGCGLIRKREVKKVSEPDVVESTPEPTEEPVADTTPEPEPEKNNENLLALFEERDVANWAADYTPVDVLAYRNRDGVTDIAYLATGKFEQTPHYYVITSINDGRMNDYTYDALSKMNTDAYFTGNDTQWVYNNAPAVFPEISAEEIIEGMNGWVVAEDIYREDKDVQVEGLPETVYYQESEVDISPIAVVIQDEAREVVLCRGVYNEETKLFFVPVYGDYGLGMVDILGYIYSYLRNPVVEAE